MIVAFLFSANDSDFGGNYGTPIRELILSTDILQQSGRHLKISIGDVSILSIAKPKKKIEIIPFCEQTYFWHPWNYINAEKIRATYLQSTVFAWVIQNITEEIAKSLHTCLMSSDSTYLYLGMHAVDYSYRIHFDLYRNGMSPMYRMQGRECNIFYSRVYDGDDRDYNGFNTFEGFGFKVKWEDIGRRPDFCNTIEHYQQVNGFVEVVAPYFDGGRDEAEDLAMLLEDLNPTLFISLEAAAQEFKQAKNEEHYAHVGTSGRRYMEKLADEVFPATDEKHNGKKVTKDKYINRLWAFIKALPISESESSDLGNKVDEIYKVFNAAIHSDYTRDRIGQAFGDVAKLTQELLSIAPKNTHKPYLPYDMSEEDLIPPF